VTERTPEQLAWLEERAHGWALYHKDRGWRYRAKKPKRLPRGFTAIKPAVSSAVWREYALIWPTKLDRKGRQRNV
jgi:hypothetical protein